MSNNSLTCHTTNEKRLIDADAMVTLMCRACNNECCEEPCEPGECFIYDALANAPTVDAVEVVHGEWSTIEDDYCGMVALHCSVCNNEWWFEEDAPIKHYHYCPNCGAKMDGDGNG